MALTAGVPQLVVPMAHDQFDHAWRIRQLGVGDWVRRYRAGDAAGRLERMLNSESELTNCQDAAVNFQGAADPLNVAAAWIERLQVRPRLSKTG